MATTSSTDLRKVKMADGCVIIKMIATVKETIEILLEICHLWRRDHRTHEISVISMIKGRVASTPTARKSLVHRRETANAKGGLVEGVEAGIGASEMVADPLQQTSTIIEKPALPILPGVTMILTIVLLSGITTKTQMQKSNGTDKVTMNATKTVTKAVVRSARRLGRPKMTTQMTQKDKTTTQHQNSRKIQKIAADLIEVYRTIIGSNNLRKIAKIKAVIAIGAKNAKIKIKVITK